jgi:hypothetical protein
MLESQQRMFGSLFLGGNSCAQHIPQAANPETKPHPVMRNTNVSITNLFTRSKAVPFSPMLAVVAALSVWINGQSLAQTLPYAETFNAGTAAGWTVLDTLGLLISQPGSVAFPGGNTYNLAHPAISSQAFISSVGPARMSSWAPTRTTNQFQMSVDVLDLPQDLTLTTTRLRQKIALTAHARDIGPGTTAGYTFHYLPLAGLLPGAGNGFEISREFGEVYQGWMTGDYSGPYPDANWYPGCNSSKTYTMDPAKDYRMVFLGSELRFEGRVYDLADLTKPVLITMCNFSQTANTAIGFTDGLAGIEVVNIFGANAVPENGVYTGPCNATLDNFSVSDTYTAFPGTPSVPSLSVNSSSGTNIVAWPGETLGLWAMEQSPALGAGAVWTDVPLWTIEYDAASGLRKHIATNSPAGFYRLRKL